MPLVPIVMPSEIAIVLNSIGVPPAVADALLDLGRERAQLVVAGHRLDPRRGDADDRLGERLVVEADALELGAGGGAGGAVEELAELWRGSRSAMERAA